MIGGGAAGSAGMAGGGAAASGVAAAVAGRVLRVGITAAQNGRQHDRTGQGDRSDCFHHASASEKAFFAKNFLSGGD